ncbi:MAG: cob(I)yrinic acid a,c-diamide adenosyltransferase [Frankiaceae bacterium]|jgi:cob(I)alamin adenosyltransferase|nr:cob(I)yrinic acid a,c-diamide adenosyltransferase [Frankiaceae bacterium]
MAVHLTRVYTRTGDDGTTALGDMTRVPKTSSRVGAYAQIDETNAAIGAALSLGALADSLRAKLLLIQNDLFDAGADLCTPARPNPKWPPLRLPESAVGRLETWCDELNEPLSALNSFILPGGTPGSALLHQARTAARRAERGVWALLEAEPGETSSVPARYLNRLSDLLFIMARTANLPSHGGSGDVLWRPAGERSPA